MENTLSRFKYLALVGITLFTQAGISIEARANSGVEIELLSLQQQVIGVVTDENGLPIPGVAISVKNSSSGTTTDLEGRYSISVGSQDVLVITYLGMVTKEEPVDGRSEINIVLEEDVTDLGQVEINAGYYYTTRRESTGNISRVTAEEIELQPVVSPIQALQGRIPGVEIEQAGGITGLASSIRIRGRNSLRLQGDYPLIIIDGVPVNSTPYSSVSSFASGAGIDPLNTLNIGNIESIEVLKDADATAIYGSRGANGVVLITTKKGNGYGEKTAFDAQVFSGISEVSNKMKLMNTKQYIEVREKAFKNDGVNPSEVNAPDLVLWDLDRDTDWQEVLLGEQASIKDIHLAVSGGSESTSFLLGGSYQNRGTVYPGNSDYNKVTSNLNLDHRSKNRKFQLTFSGNYGLDNNDLFMGTNYVHQALTLAPNAPAVYNEDGSLNWENGSWSNPLAGLYQPVDIKSYSFVSNMSLSYKILEGLIVKVNSGYSDFNSDERLRTFRNSFNPANWDHVTLSSTHSSTKRNSWLIEPQILFERKLGDMQLSALAGATFQYNKNTFESFEGSGYSDDRLVGNLDAADEVHPFPFEKIEYKYAAAFGRIGINWSKKYYLNLTGRRDGSSRFGKDRRFSGFWALGGAWIFSEEKPLRNSPFLSFGKIRGSYGTTGSDQIPDYGYFDIYEPTPGPGGLYPTQLSNPDYSWEVNRKLEAALQLGFLDDNINLEVSWYRNRSSNQLVGYPLSAITGFSSVQANLPALIENQGWEMVLVTNNIEAKDFFWQTSFNATFPKNKLLEFEDLEMTPYRQIYKVDYPLDISIRYKYDGIDPETGLYRVTDVNNDGRLDFSDQVAIERLGRKFYWGFHNNISFKNFHLNFLMEYVNQKRPTYLSEMSNAPGRLGNNSTEILNAWTQPGDQTDIQRLSQSIPSLLAYLNVLNSDLVIGDASFLRLKTITLTYQLPSRLTGRIGLKGIQLFLHGQNLFTISDYKGLDPQGGKIVPPLRTVTSGLKLTF